MNCVPAWGVMLWGGLAVAQQPAPLPAPTPAAVRSPTPASVHPAPPPASRPNVPAAARPAPADGGGPMVATFDEMLRKLARGHHSAGLKSFRSKDYPAALHEFKKAYELNRRDAQITNDLAYLYQLLGNHQEAERYYRETLLLDRDRAVAHLNLADLLNQKGASQARLAEAAEHLRRARELRGNQRSVILRQARLAVARGRFGPAQRFYREYLARRKPSDALRLEIGDLYRDFGREDEASSWYRQITSPKLRPVAARRLWQVEVDRQARRFGWTRRPGGIPRKARALVARARALLGQGRWLPAERLLRRALRLAPQFAMARADLGDALRSRGRRREAELAYLRALALEQGNAEIYARLGDLYVTAKRPGRAAEATLFFARALQLRPDWVHLHLELAKACRAAGDLPRALRHVVRFLSEPTSGAKGREARVLKRALEQILSKRPAPPRPPSRSVEGSRILVQALARARAFLGQGLPEAAMAELRRLSEQERGPRVLNLEGRILYAAGRIAEAAKTFRASLGRDERQGDVHEQLGLIRARQSRLAEARRHLERAEALGSPEAPYHLARLGVGEQSGGLFGWMVDLATLGRLREADQRLERFLARHATSLYRDAALDLQEKIEGRIRAAFIGAGSLGAFVVLVGLLIWIRLWGGADLGRLLRRHPEAGPEVQRVLSAIRHEVLKHNTLVLTGLAEALARGEPAAEKAAHCRQSLFGVGSGEGAAERLRTYADQLRHIGRSHGMRLNLRRRDAALSALLKGFRLLERVAPLLDRVDGLTSAERARLLKHLRSSARLLNAEGYEAVRALLDRLRVLEVDEALLRGIFERTRREPALAGVRLAPLGIEGATELPCRVLLPRPAFEDILANLIRNAIQSSLRHGDEEVAVGLAVDRDLDPITGIERIVFLIQDRSPQVLTTEMLRGRYIEEGLGLTADLVSRYEGTLDVFPGTAGWTKAVAVKLPGADAAPRGET